MDAFETVVSALLEGKGFWTRRGVKVEVTKEDKRQIGRPSSPRWELEIVAYRGRTNELWIVECKSFLDSLGVRRGAFDGTDPEAAKRYKLFVDPTLRRVVVNRLKRQLFAQGFCGRAPKVTLCLAAGKIHSDGAWLRRHFEKKGWLLLDPSSLRQELAALAGSGYQDTVTAIVTKLLLRERRKSGPANKRLEPAAAARHSSRPLRWRGRGGSIAVR